ncbi:hypothetical protein AAFF_G00022380 [Aldrovandia affinis]|uniref:Uncharacterized protein n=1 Tax=Aldrovandia affinis TaxID=143900 RepID=A0AAD7R322_9TELE|nr:hypothetical protein AAFF_G00022380 [Aldrovandia affinis]
MVGPRWLRLSHGEAAIFFRRLVLRSGLSMPACGKIHELDSSTVSSEQLNQLSGTIIGRFGNKLHQRRAIGTGHSLSSCRKRWRIAVMASYVELPATAKSHRGFRRSHRCAGGSAKTESSWRRN